MKQHTIPGGSCAIPTPKSQSGAIRLIDPVDQAGITAWKTRGADLRRYLDGDGSDD